MTFENAVEKIRGGGKIRREAWNEDNFLMRDSHSGHLLMQDTVSESYIGWVPKIEDISACDWETVGEEHKVTLEDFSTHELFSELKKRKAIYTNYDSLLEETIVFAKVDGRIW